MSEEYGSDFIQIVDEEGNEYDLEVLDTLEYNDITYMALIPAGAEEESDDDELIILKVIIEDGEEILSTPDDDDELDNVYNMFMDRLFIEEEEDEE